MSEQGAEYAHLVETSTHSHALDRRRTTPVVARDWRHETVDRDSSAALGRAVAAPGTAVRVLPAGGGSDAPRPRRWLRRYQLTLLSVDMCAALAAIIAGRALRGGAVPRLAAHADPWLTLVVIPVAWVCVLAVGRGYEAKMLGSGPTEFERVLRAFLHLTALTAFVVCAGRVALSRHLVLLVLPFILVLSVAGRCAARVVLRVLRQSGRATFSVLAIGEAADVSEFVAQLRHDKSSGCRVVGRCGPEPMDEVGDRDTDGMSIPQYGGLDRLVEAVDASGADAVAVLSARIKPDRLRWISWQLENSDTMLFVAPGLTEVAGRRLHIQQLSGLPLLSVAQPSFGGVRRLVKSAFDRTVALLALLVLSPLLAMIAVLVRVTSPGPALFWQDRVGKGGETFRIVKFRTMTAGSELRIPELVQSNDVRGGVLFKMRNDPRVTRVGKVLRRYSLDELPQLFNVLCGSMSLVGPRPPLPSEVARYAVHDKRRLLVKPGLTGLWQVSGRSDLSWEESTRLDLRYVENWSLTTDLMILGKTFFAVLRRDGAY